MFLVMKRDQPGGENRGFDSVWSCHMGCAGGGEERCRAGIRDLRAEDPESWEGPWSCQVWVADLVCLFLAG